MFRRGADKHERDPRRLGMAVAVGLPVDDSADTADKARGLSCPSCGSAGHIDMIDTAARTAYLSCPACGRTWETDRASVTA